MTYSYQQLRQIFGAHAKSEGQYAGVPMPVTETALVVSDRMPWHAKLNGFKFPSEDEPPSKGEEEQRYTLINSWYDRRHRRTVAAMRQQDGKSVLGLEYNDGPGARLAMTLSCMGISQTMDIAAERRAMELLRSLIKPHLMDGYEMTGAFLETSRRSGVTYVFRRLATTLALRGTRIIGALCLHPIAYYSGLPMGAMVPTDDVVAHLLMMRGDEVRFWRKANQHGPFSPGAML